MKDNTAYVTPEEVRNQLQLLLNQEEFKRSPILAKFLEYVVLTKLDGHQDEIKEYTIGIKVLGRPSDFNPQLDAIVRIHASRLRNILHQYYNRNGIDAPILISIPKGTYVPLYELNNGNLKHHILLQKEINGFGKQVPFSNDAHTNTVMAVLPFHDLSPEKTNDGLLTTLGEQLSSELAKFDNLSVISYYATQKMDAAVDHLKELKNEGIDYVLTGSLRLFNGTMRLNFQLLAAESGNILWTDSFLRHLITNENAFEVQEEIISQIANAIADDPKMLSTLNKRRQIESLQRGNLVQDAIDMYFDYTYDYNSKKFEGALRACENACKIAEDHVLLISILAKLYLDLYACATEQNKDFLYKGLELSRKAVGIDPRSQFAQKALAWGLILSGEKHRVEEAIDHCVNINPIAASSLSTLGLGLIMMGKFEKGYGMIMKSVKFQKNFSACTKLGLSLYYYQTKNYIESIKWLDLLPPFDIPFCKILNASICGILNIAPANELITEVLGNERDIVNRIVLDPKLRIKIMDGWRQAVLVLK